ncbi:MAG TPA: hypothetical protein VEF34_00700 [Syntrophobacteraceae bacterium]|nr:hypothetical protein [Syntrophobacteraceae bacterium]
MRPQGYAGYKAKNKKRAAGYQYDGAENTGVLYGGQNCKETEGGGVSQREQGREAIARKGPK